MTPLDWTVLASWLALAVAWGVWRGGHGHDTRDYVLAGRQLAWPTVTLSIMATQASAITFLSTPGQAWADGVRFVQFYLGLPIAMVLIAAIAVPLYRSLNVYTAYEFLERRFDLKTRSLAAFLFLLQRGLAAGLTIYAPALILSVMLGWDIRPTILVIGALAVAATATGGTRAVARTQTLQAFVILAGMTVAFAAIVGGLPEGVSLGDAWHVAGAAGRLDAIDPSLDPRQRYTLWSGLIGGAFLALSYFGTDQSQVQRYLAGQSTRASRLGLLANGMLKVPMQFGILLVGATLFAYHQFAPHPVFFDPVAVERVRSSEQAARFAAAEQRFKAASAERAERARELIAARDADAGEERRSAAREAWRAADRLAGEAREDAIAAVRESGASTGSDVNYVFLSFVVHTLPAGLVGLVLAAVLAAAMNSVSAELNALSATTVVDLYRRLLAPDAPESRAALVGRLATVGWGAFAVGFAEFAGRLGSLVEAVNILGSLFYGTILGIFVLAALPRRPSGTSVWVAAALAEAIVVACWALTPLSFLWFNAIGCLSVVTFAWAAQPLLARR